MQGLWQVLELELGLGLGLGLVLQRYCEKCIVALPCVVLPYVVLP